MEQCTRENLSTAVEITHEEQLDPPPYSSPPSCSPCPLYPRIHIDKECILFVNGVNGGVLTLVEGKVRVRSWERDALSQKWKIETASFRFGFRNQLNGKLLGVQNSNGNITGVQPKIKGGRRSLHRLWAGFMDFLDGQSHSRDTAKGLEKLTHGSFFRLNTILQRPIRLDNTSDLDELRKSVCMSPTFRMETKNVVLALLCSNFYLALNGKPNFDSGSYRYNASIRCRADCSAVISALDCLCPSTKRFVTQTEILGDCSLEDICHRCCRYRKQITITVRHPSDFVTISIQSGREFMWKISAFPQRMSWFEEQGGLNHIFGSKDYDVSGALQCPTCTPQCSTSPGTPATWRQKRTRRS